MSNRNIAKTAEKAKQARKSGNPLALPNCCVDCPLLVGGGLGYTNQRNHFYADELASSKKWTKWGWGLFALVTVLGLPLSFYAGHKPASVIGITPTGQVFPVPMLNKPYVTPEALRRFCVDSIADIQSFNELNYTTHLDAIKWRWGHDAYAAYKTQLKERQVEQAVHANHQVWNAGATWCSPLKEGQLPDGRYWWLMEAKGLLTVASGGSAREFNSKYTIEIVRASPTESPEYLQIYNWQEERH
jgi:hypothetical protein